MKTNEQVALKVNEREIPSAPESPAYWNNSESSAWQSGWVSGYMAALAAQEKENG